jgi:mono/diheme cytochrome c family protein
MLPAFTAAIARGAAVESLPPASGAAIAGALGCAACHTGLGVANDAERAAPPLDDVGSRYSPGYLFAYLANPSVAPRRTGRARMPGFHLDAREALALAIYLSTQRRGAIPARAAPAPIASLPGAGAAALDTAFARARAAFPTVTAEAGARIFQALNCAGCHRSQTVAAGPAPTPWMSGPDLGAEGSRVRPEWLKAFLRRPRAVRPFGAYPGTGSRMPDFRLSDQEADSLAAWLLAKRIALPPDVPQELTPFRRGEVETLLRDRLPCLGCHALGGEGGRGAGGRIGPDLGAVGTRLTPAYIRAILTDPAEVVPWAIMPPPVISPALRERLVSYLAAGAPGASDTQRTALGSGEAGAASARDGYLSLVDHPPLAPAVAAVAWRDASGEALYRRICANCHGLGGRGDGWNARYLPVRPTVHAAAPYMSTRPDATLYDGIAAGGAILGRSNRMPAFGGMLSRAQIWSLVAYLRTLCRCEGPAWSRDGSQVGSAGGGGREGGGSP